MSSYNKYSSRRFYISMNIACGVCTEKYANGCTESNTENKCSNNKLFIN